ncbi:MAG: molybdopterin-dependent oxidoreductase, partial [Terriglobales bacterium]
RFYREYAGGSDLEAQAIAERVYFGRAEDGVLENPFAGNLAEVCPTGVFTDATLKRHYSRKWDLRWSPSICAHCSLGCNISPGERYGAVRATVNRYHPDINRYFLCDRGRFAYEYLESPARALEPRIRGAAVAPAGALAHCALLLQAAAASPGSLIGIGSPRASLESNFALRALVGPERFFAGMAAAELELALQIADLLRHPVAPAPSLAELERCDAAIVLGEDLTQSAARMALSLRQLVRQQPLAQVSDPLGIPRWLDQAAREAIQDARGPLFLLLPWATQLDDIAATCHRAAPDELARLGFQIADDIQSGAPQHPIARALLAAQRPLVVSGPTCASSAMIAAAAAIAAALGARGRPAALSFVLAEANTLGLALLAPRPLREGLDLVRFGHASTAIVLECDLTRRAPAAELDHFQPPHLIVLDQISHPLAQRAELLLPAASAFESDGTFVNNEARAQRFFQVSPPAPGARESWRWLENAQGADPSLDQLLARLASAFPELASAATAAPPASFRLAQQKLPRETHRSSGRTAISAQLDVSEPRPPLDPDSALSFTM